MDEAIDDLTVTDNPAMSRYEARLDDRVVGVSVYTIGDGGITLVHTEVDPSVEGRGIGSRLARSVVDASLGRGLAVTVQCPFISAWLRRHAAEYPDLVPGGAGAAKP
jgi:hypothetical protein